MDFDSFFASVEQQCNPYFRGKPIGITATNGKTCIIAASREAKIFGISNGSRTYDALLWCPDIIFVSANFDKYYEVSKKFLQICQQYTPYIELFSIDEVFMDMTQTIHLFGDIPTVITIIKEHLAREIGPFITVSVGVSYNKLLAKLASKKNKPNGLFVITPENRRTVYAISSLEDICGIGNNIKKRLNINGIYTLHHLEKTPLIKLITEFGKIEGIFLKNIGLGIDNDEIIFYTDIPSVKSLSRNYSFDKNEYNQRFILQNIYELSEDIARRLRSLNKKAKTIRFSLRGNRIECGQRTFLSHTSSGKNIFIACRDFYKQWKWNNLFFPEQGMVRVISILVENFIINSETISLFQKDRDEKALTEAIDILNKRFGDYTIRKGFLLNAKKLKIVPNGYLADKHERTKLALESQISI
ncbi:MAG: hypothetical protein NTZ20_02125 [Candidatus Levybacteria bacterium]|nr:hypothetical protein [Candidatus Levybacteria bacterium]